MSGMYTNLERSNMKGKKKPEKTRVVNSMKATKRVLILSAAFLMEEQDWDDDALVEYYEAICRWSDAIQDHWISIDQVINMINEKTGAQIRW